MYLPGVSKKYPLLTGNRNEMIRYDYSLHGQLSLSIFSLDSHTLHLNIAHKTPGIKTCKVKTYNASETRGFVKGLLVCKRPYMYFGAVCSHFPNAALTNGRC